MYVNIVAKETMTRKHNIHNTTNLSHLRPTEASAVGGIVRRKRSRELRFGEFAPECSAFLGVQKLRKRFHDKLFGYITTVH